MIPAITELLLRALGIYRVGLQPCLATILINSPLEFTLLLLCLFCCLFLRDLGRILDCFQEDVSEFTQLRTVCLLI